MKAKLHFTAIVATDLVTDRRLALVGREAWALLELVEAGAKGCTPLHNPAPRWSDYVFRLRGHRIEVQTVHEDHGGPFAGHHARYVLRTPVTLEEGNLDEWRPAGVRYPERERSVA